MTPEWWGAEEHPTLQSALSEIARRPVTSDFIGVAVGGGRCDRPILDRLDEPLCHAELDAASVGLEAVFWPDAVLTVVLLSNIVDEEVVVTAKASISLTDEQEAYARSLVESGQYASLSAVLQRGLEMLRRDCEMREAELQGLRLLVDQRRAGAFVDIEAGEAETRAMISGKRRKGAAV